MRAETAVEELGVCGVWQMTSYLSISIFMNMQSSFHMLSIVWIGHTPEHHCRVSEGVSIKDSILQDSNGKLSQCLKYVNLSLSNQTMACDQGWTYDPHDSYTIVNQWDLVCQNQIFSQIPQTVLVVGVMIGAFFFSVLSDKYGRKPVFMSCQIMIMIVGLACVLVHNFYLFLGMRFSLGMLNQGIFLSGFILLTEIVPHKHRAFFGIISQVFWSVFSVLLAFLAYLLPNWIHLQIIISLFALFNIPFFCVMPESLQWLIANGKEEKAKKTIMFAANMNQMNESEISSLMNRISFSNDKKLGNDDCSNIADIQDHSQEPHTAYTLLDFFKSPRLMLNLAIMSFAWAVIALVYFGLTLTTGERKGNRFMNGFYHAIVELPAYIVTYLLIRKFGRKKPLSGMFLLSSVSIILMPFTENINIGGVELTFLPNLFSTLGKFAITSSFSIIFLYIAEIFPTQIRNQAIGISSFFGKIGNIMATFTAYTMKRHLVLVCMLFSLLSFAAGLLVLILPETHNRHLPQSIEEVESWTRTIIPNANAANEFNSKQKPSSQKNLLSTKL